MMSRGAKMIDPVFAILVAAVFFLGSTVWFQTSRVIKYQNDLEAKDEVILQLNRSVRLTDDLRKDNAELIQERDDLLGELRASSSLSKNQPDLLPDGIRSIVERMRDSER